MNLYSALANVVVVFHFLYALAIIIGLVIIYVGRFLDWKFVQNTTFRLIHFAMIAVVAFESLFNIECPLTYIEYQLLNLAHVHHQSTPFIASFINHILFWNLPNIFFNILYIAIALFVMLSFFIVPINLHKKSA